MFPSWPICLTGGVQILWVQDVLILELLIFIYYFIYIQCLLIFIPEISRILEQWCGSNSKRTKPRNDEKKYYNGFTSAAYMKIKPFVDNYNILLYSKWFQSIINYSVFLSIFYFQMILPCPLSGYVQKFYSLI